MPTDDSISTGRSSALISNVPFPPHINLKGNLSKNWKSWRQVWNAYETVTHLSSKSDEERVATFITCIGIEALEVHNSLPFTTDADKSNISTILQLWEDYCVGKTNVIYERFLFNERSQEQDEPIEKYVSSLRTLSSTCDYGSLQDELIRDRIVCGIQDNSLRRKLLQESNLTLDTCISKCKASELTLSQMKMLTGTEAPVGDQVNYVRKKTRGSKSTNNPTTVKRFYKPDSSSRAKSSTESPIPQNITDCLYCGGEHERDRNKCPAFGKVCIKCGVENHFAKKCKQLRNRRFKGRRKTAYRVTRSDEDEDLLFISFDINSIGTQPKYSIFADMVIDNKTIKMQVDSGASCNVLPNTKVPEHTKLSPTNKRLVTYSREYIPVLGKCILKVQNPKTDRVYNVEFVVVKGTNIPLLGSKAAQGMDLIRVQYDNIQSSESIHKMSTPDILSEFKDVFQGLGKFGPTLHLDIDESVQPVIMPPRRVALALREPLKLELQSMVDDGIIAPVQEPTKWVSSLVVVKKASGKLRVCIDPQPLNTALRRCHYPLPVIEDILPELTKVKVFSKADLSKGFLQIEMDEQSSYLTTFQTPWGRYRYLRMPFGISPAPEIFQRMLDQCLENLPGVFKLADDIIISGKGDTRKDAVIDHDKNLRLFLNRCRERNIKLNRDKFVLNCNQIPFFGHVLTHEGLKPDPNKVKAITSMVRPVDVAGVQRLIGMIKYLSRFLQGLSEMCEPIRRLTHKDVTWCWTDEQDRAFEQIKAAVVTTPVLKYFDPECATEGQGDASMKGLGFVLMQNDQPVTYSSRTLTKAEENYSQIEKELLAQVFGLERNHQYLYGRKVLLWTDHKPLVTIYKKPLILAPKRLQRLLLRLQNYDVEIKYKAGSEMYLADTLSRASIKQDISEADQEMETVHMLDYLPMSEPQVKEIQVETAKDVTLQSLKNMILKGWPEDKSSIPDQLKVYHPFCDELAVQDGVIFRGLRCVVPTSLRPKIRSRLHTAHTGIQSCLRRAREVVYWPGMNGDLTDYISKCETCNTYQNHQQNEPIVCRNVPNRPWEYVASDIFTFKSKDYLCTVDYYSDYFEVDRLYEKTAAEVIKKTKRIFAAHGIPDYFYSDNMPYNSKEFREFTKEYSFEHITSSPEYAQSNGKAENAVKIAKTLMKKSSDSGSDFYLSLLEWRNTPSEIIGTSPVQRLYSRRTRTLLPTARKLLQPEVSSSTNENLQRRKLKQSYYYDRKGVKELTKLKDGSIVRIQPSVHDKDKKWTKARVEQQVDIRSYDVRTEDGRVYRRNRKYLKSSTEPFHPNVNVPLQPQPSQQPTQPSTTTCIPEKPVENPVVEISKKPTTRASPSKKVPTTPQVSPPTSIIPSRSTRSGRSVKLPKYLQDYSK